MAAPVITGITNNEGNLTNPDTTPDPALTLKGTGTADTVVLIYNKDVIKSATEIEEGVWEVSLTADPDTNSFTARSTGGEASLPWVVNVRDVTGTERFESLALGMLVVDQEYVLPSGLTLTVLGSEALVFIPSEVDFKGQALSMYAAGRYKFTLSEEASHFALSFKGHSTLEKCKISFYGPSNQLIESHELETGPAFERNTYEVASAFSSVEVLWHGGGMNMNGCNLGDLEWA